MNKKKVLIFSLFAMAIVGIAYTATPFLRSLSPADGAIYKWQTTINISNQKTGELVEYKNEQGSIWVYKRTAEQVKWLSTFKPTKTKEFVARHSQSEEFDEITRSISPEYFVFTEWKRNEKTYLQEGRSWYPCGTIKYYEGSIKVSDEQSFLGAIACLENHETPKFDYEMFVYNVAGMPQSEYVAPLQVPYYEFKENGNIVVGPRP